MNILDNNKNFSNYMNDKYMHITLGIIKNKKYYKKILLANCVVILCFTLVLPVKIGLLGFSCI